MTEQFRAKWTNEIQNEWMRNLLAKRKDLTEAQLQRTVELMNQSVPDCLVEKYEGLIDSLELLIPFSQMKELNHEAATHRNQVFK